jgi:formate hydrogenlyase transcriptional activator
MQMVENGAFRADLFYRLSVFPIVIPPLRERREDIPLLAHFFTRKLAQKMQRDIRSIPMRTLRQLCDHSWPGNVRELANVIEHAVIISDGPELYLPPMELTTNAGYFNLSEAFPQEAIPAVTGGNRRFHADESEDERARIIKALVESNGVVAGARGAAAKLGLKRTTLLSRMQRMGINAKV